MVLTCDHKGAVWMALCWHSQIPWVILYSVLFPIFIFFSHKNECVFFLFFSFLSFFAWIASVSQASCVAAVLLALANLPFLLHFQRSSVSSGLASTAGKFIFCLLLFCTLLRIFVFNVLDDLQIRGFVFWKQICPLSAFVHLSEVSVR